MSNSTSPAIQAMNLVRYIGDEVLRLGKPIHNLDCINIRIMIGSPSDEFVKQLIEDLKNRGTVKGSFGPSGYFSFLNANLTLDGWEQYEAEKRGKFQGNYGFIAMKFGDSELDPFVTHLLCRAGTRLTLPPTQKTKEGGRSPLAPLGLIGRDTGRLAAPG